MNDVLKEGSSVLVNNDEESKSAIEIAIDYHHIYEGSLFVSWKVREDVINDFWNEGFHEENLFMLIIVVHKKTFKETRYLFPASDKICWIPFYGSGDHRLFAVLVANADSFSPFHKLKQSFLEKLHDFVYEQRLIKDDGTDEPTLLYFFVIFEQAKHMLRSLPYFDEEAERKLVTYIDLEVPEEAFAQKEPRWLWWWVNLYYKKPASNTFEFIKRLPYSFTLKPIFFLIVQMARFILLIAMILARIVAVGVLLICLKTRINPKPLWDLNCDLEEIWEDLGPSLWFYPIFEFQNIRLFWYTVPVSMPGKTYSIHPFLLLLTGLSLGYLFIDKAILVTPDETGARDFVGVAVWIFMVLSFACLVGLCVYVLFIALYRNVFLKKDQRLMDHKPKTHISRRERKELRRDELEQKQKLEDKIEKEQLIHLLSSDEPLKISINDLPKEHQTMKLRYQKLKQCFCRPFKQY